MDIGCAEVEPGGRSALMMIQRWLGMVRTDFGEKVAEEQAKKREEVRRSGL